MPKQERINLIQEIEKERDSHLICYIVGDRPNLQFMISGDTPRLFYDHLIFFPDDNKKIDLFLYSSGGDTSVPWRIVSTFREFTDEISVLVPFKALSAATMIALGADSIIMGKKGELSPIDPAVNTPFNPRDPTTNQPLPINVEDVTAYISLIREQVQLADQDEVARVFEALPKSVSPLALGYVNRHLSFIRLVAKKLLSSHKKKLDENKIDQIVESLVKKIYFHGHSIGRREAKDDLNLKIEEPNENLEKLMWSLYLEYEKSLRLTEPFIPEDILEAHGSEEHVESGLIAAYIESRNTTDVCKGDVRIKRVRELPPNINLNFTLQFPPNIDPSNITPAQMRTLQQEVQRIVLEQIRLQSPIKGYEVHRIRFSWQKE